MGFLADRLSALTNPAAREGRQEASEDLEASSQAILSLVGSLAVLVGRDGQVVRSSPDAYRLGIVSQDRIVDERVEEAVRQAWQSDKVSRFSLTTATPEAFADLPGLSETQEGADQGGDHDDGALSEVSRPNWLKVAVGPISLGLVLVLIDDVSEAKRFEQTRQAFIEHVSRQLSRPISSLGALAESLTALAKGPWREGERLEERMAAVSSQAKLVKDYSRYLEHTLGDLILLIRAQEETSASKTERMDLGEQASKALDAARPQAEEAGVNLVCRSSGPLPVLGDPEQVRVAVSKLVENAIRYSPAGSKVSLEAKPSADGSFGLVQVIDRGAGIRKEDQAHVFERFYRGDEQTEASQVGIGLGLSIVKHVALTHHGSVKLWSAPGQGSTFTLALPLAPAPAPASASDPSAVPVEGFGRTDGGPAGVSSGM
ncbi:Sensor-like histidine kinase senX3 [Bifidobacterium actinocoloniiforme DSM 22766]|uniref:histidine kinase n=1 Tax=Bifidobacterium actinocoloniiforme DSM 22766 TaxID=1437605 RepID=A0A086Z1R0_9BIFI|nr:ATP-binding protein [Bifidobacterium actinocoloniiforme]KFI40460.1 Sensor-like histidine kinase senX3 [Bifidobacterium actinocoloniiforme DSM 22766]